ncbi:MAG: PP2C family serine/threonine-protein phosphatase [Pyrinomonadaceae bacterium]
MTANQSLPEWRVIGETVPGASHLRARIPNQDSLLQLRESGRSLPLIVSVSDGHGSNKCFRSDWGSRFAVKRAALLVGEFLDERRGNFDLAEIESKGREWLPQEFVKRWREAVEADLKRRPFTAQEFDTLVKKESQRARELVEANPLLAYGATSLTVAVEESFILYLQLGDGDMLTVSEQGGVARPLSEDKRLFANETTSLCTAGAERDFRFHLQKISGSPPALITLSTDGYVNSFSSEEGFLKVGTDLLEMLRTDGFNFVNESLKGWLEEATHEGSGDDTTLAIICRMEALKQPAAPPAPPPQETAQSKDATSTTPEPNAEATPPPAPVPAQAEVSPAKEPEAKLA